MSKSSNSCYKLIDAKDFVNYLFSDMSESNDYYILNTVDGEIVSLEDISLEDLIDCPEDYVFLVRESDN
mgnify:CR=1 FL=1